MKARCKRCFTVLRRREIALSNELKIPYEMCSDCLGREEQAMSDQLSWSELAELTHKTQVEKFNWCSCEDNEGQENPYNDCPSTDITTEVICGDCLYPMSKCGHFKS